MPEGDSLHRAALRLQAIVGQRVDAESPHPRAQVGRIAERIDGKVLESVTAHGKNLLLRFEGGVVVRSHLRLTGRWTLRPRGERRSGKPWLVLRGESAEAVLWNGPVLELHTRALGRLGPDILERPPRIDEMLARLRASDGSRWFGEALLDQSLVAGIGNMWLAEALWEARLSPWRRLAAVGEDERRRALETAAELMRASVDRGRGGRTRSTAGSGGRARAAGRGSGRGGRATTTAWRTGARRAR